VSARRFDEFAARQVAGTMRGTNLKVIPPPTDRQLAAMVRLRDAAKQGGQRTSGRTSARLVEIDGRGHPTPINDVLANMMEGRAEGTSRPLDAVIRDPCGGVVGIPR
jgi:hypothetical protein